MARLLAAILACSLGCCSSSSCSSSGSALDQSCQARDESLHLLQLKAKSMSMEATQGQATPVAIITAYNDSQCTYETGAVMNVSLSPDACFLGWTFNCTCVGDSKALIGKHYESLVCQSGPSLDHIIPVGTCVDGNATTESSDVFEIADDLGSCPCCGESCTDSSALEETAKESRPKVGKPSEHKGDYDKDGLMSNIKAKMFRGKKCKDKNPVDSMILKASKSQFSKDKGSSTKKDLKKKLITLGYKFLCGCKGRKKLLEVLRKFDFADKLKKKKEYEKKKEEENKKKQEEKNIKKKQEEEKNKKVRLMDEPDEKKKEEKFEKLFSLLDGECFDFDGDFSMITDLLNCPPCKGTCTVCGDPHVTVFDDAEVALLGTGIGMKRESSQRTEDVNDEFGWGDFWLVKSSEVSMQARYRKVYYPQANQPLNNTYLTAMAVGGPFMRGHRLIVEPRIGSVAWVHPDGSSMELFPSDETSDNDEDKEQFFEHGDLIKANYSKRTAIVANHGIVQGLDVELPSGVTLVIDRFGKHLDLRIEMTASAGGEGGVDGQCGNFNGDATDDTTELLEQRIGYQVPTDELLFI